MTWKVFLLKAIKVVLFLLLTSSFCGCKKKHVQHQTLKIDNSRKIRLVKEDAWEVSQPFLFEIIEKNNIIIPLTDFYYHNPDEPIPEFLLVKANPLVGVSSKSNPKKLFIIHDFSSGDNWPHRKDTDTWKEEKARRIKLLKAFNKVAGGGYSCVD